MKILVLLLTNKNIIFFSSLLIMFSLSQISNLLAVSEKTNEMSAHIISEKKRTSDVSSGVECDFESLLLSVPVLDGLKKCGFVRPSPIQVQAIPLAKFGVDLVCQAKSGTGKTCVFAVCALETVDIRLLVTQVLVLAPTREIAHQIHGVVTSIGGCVEGLNCGLFIGGISMKHDMESVRRCHVAIGTPGKFIGTPGRVRHLIEKGYLATSSIRLFILDEADKLLEKGSFEEQINWIYSTLSRHKQVLALSATYPEQLAKHLNNYMQDAVHVRINSADVVLKGVMQYFIEVKFLHLSNKLFDLKCRTLIDTISKLPFQQCMVFSNYHSRAERLCQALNKVGWPSTFITGSQVQSERLKAITRLKEYNCRILITTDLTSRGIDCDKVNLVINLDLPWDTETYFHRIGRAGRFGSYGMAISIISTGEEKDRLKTIEASMNRKIQLLPVDNHALLWTSGLEHGVVDGKVQSHVQENGGEKSVCFVSSVVAKKCVENQRSILETQSVTKDCISCSENRNRREENTSLSCVENEITITKVKNEKTSDCANLYDTDTSDNQIAPSDECSLLDIAYTENSGHLERIAEVSSTNLPKYLKLFDRRKKSPSNATCKTMKSKNSDERKITSPCPHDCSVSTKNNVVSLETHQHIQQDCRITENVTSATEHPQKNGNGKCHFEILYHKDKSFVNGNGETMVRKDSDLTYKIPATKSHKKNRNEKNNRSSERSHMNIEIPVSHSSKVKHSNVSNKSVAIHTPSTDETSDTEATSRNREWNQKYFMDKYYQAYYDHIGMMSNCRLFYELP